MPRTFTALAMLSLAVFALRAPAAEDHAADLIEQARAAWRNGKLPEALDLARRATREAPENPQAHLLYGALLDARGEHKSAVAEFDASLRLDPKLADAYDLRGSVQFKRGKFTEAVADFDRFLALQPSAGPGHWRRGIALYYVGRYADGRDQFKGYESVDTNDVENAVWHFLCVAKLEGVTKARKAMLKIGKDRRVPMSEVYELYLDKLTPADVLAAAESGTANEAERRGRLFYAHLYLGLFYDATGDRQRALEHMELAAGKFSNPQYMGDVARVHAELLRQATKAK